jgi:hypothetical protein
MSMPIGLGLLCSLLLSPVDPPGTRDISIELGATWKAPAPDAAEVVCDDPLVVEGTRTQGMASFTGLRAGATLCAVRTVSGAPVAAYRITVMRSSAQTRRWSDRLRAASASPLLSKVRNGHG